MRAPAVCQQRGREAHTESFISLETLCTRALHFNAPAFYLQAVWNRVLAGVKAFFLG